MYVMILGIFICLYVGRIVCNSMDACRGVCLHWCLYVCLI